MGRKKNKSSKPKVNKNTSNKTAQNSAKPSDASTSISQSVAVQKPDANQQVARDEQSRHDHVSKRDEFERSRSDSSRHDSECESSHDKSRTSLSQGHHQQFSVLQESTTSSAAELTQEALTIHTQLLHADEDTAQAESAASVSTAAAAVEKGETPKRCSLASHDDVESGVGTFSVQSSDVIHREDTFNIDVQDEMCCDAEVYDHVTSGVAGSPNTLATSDDKICDATGRHSGASDAASSDHKQQRTGQAQAEIADATSSSPTTLSRQTSRDAAMSQSLSRDTGSGNLISSQSLPFSTLSKSSTGYAFHSTGSEFALTTSQSIGDDLNDDVMAQSTNTQSRAVEAATAADDDNDIVSPRDFSSRDSLSHDAKQSSRADDAASCRQSLEHDLESSVDSALPVNHHIKFSDPGVSLFDELQQCRTSDSFSSRSAAADAAAAAAAGDSPGKSRADLQLPQSPDKSRSSCRADAGNDTLGSVDAQIELGNVNERDDVIASKHQPLVDSAGDSPLSISDLSKQSKSMTSSIKEADATSSAASDTLPSVEASRSVHTMSDGDEHLMQSYLQQLRRNDAPVNSQSVSLRYRDTRSFDVRSNTSSERLLPSERSSDNLHESVDAYSDAAADDDIVVRELHDSDLSLNQSHLLEQSVDEILENREHVSNTVASMNQEIENLRAENNQLYSEMTSYRKACKQYKSKVGELDGYLRALRGQVKTAEIKLAEVNTQRQNVTSSSAMTDNALLLNTAVQVAAASYNAETQITVPTVNRSCQSERSGDGEKLTVDRHTLTVETSCGVAGSGSGEDLAAAGTTRQTDLARAGVMLDQILRQVNGAAG